MDTYNGVTMKIDIEATDFELTESLRDYIEEKIGKLGKFLKSFDEGSVSARVEVGRVSKHHKSGDVYRAEANVRFPGGLIRAEHVGDDVRVAINKVKDKLKREIKERKRTAY